MGLPLFNFCEFLFDFPDKKSSCDGYSNDVDDE
jgi:hypothetical protein